MASLSSQTTPVTDSDNRRHQRLDIEASAKIKLKNGKVFDGKTRNISYKGAFFEFDQVSEVIQGEYCLLTIDVKDALNSMVLKLKCKVVHAHEDGIGVEIKDFYDDDYNDFVFLLANNSPDPEKFLAELSEQPEFKLVW